MSRKACAEVHVVVGAIFLLLGGACVAYLWAGGSVVEPERPLLVLGVLLIALAAGLAGRSRAAALLVRAGLGAGMVALGWATARYLTFRGLGATDDALGRVYLLGIALAATAVITFFMLVRHVPYGPVFRGIDLLSFAGVAVTLTLGVVWLVGDDARLRPCRLGDDTACDVVATRLLESAERAPGTPPTPWEDEAARVLDLHGCRGPGPCAVHRYASGSVALRAGRFDAARDAFLRACDEDRSWCARAAQERSMPWAPADRERLEGAR